MNKKILIISTTLRNNGNSSILAKKFEKGAKEAGNQVEYMSLDDKQVAFCKGCLACQKTQQCVIRDDAVEITDKAKNADVIVFATPVYYYEMSGQMKTLLDRMNPLFPSDYAFRDIYLIGTAAESDKNALNGAISGLNGWISCFGKVKLRDVVYGVGATDCGDIEENSLTMKVAYEMGKNV